MPHSILQFFFQEDEKMKRLVALTLILVLGIPFFLTLNAEAATTIGSTDYTLAIGWSSLSMAPLDSVKCIEHMHNNTINGTITQYNLAVGADGYPWYETPANLDLWLYVNGVNQSTPDSQTVSFSWYEDADYND